MKIGIIITCFNNASAINACIESVANIKKLTEGKLSLELFSVVIDDCSTDASFQMLGRFFEEDKIDHLLKNDVNQGVSFSRNRGISFCHHTDYITFLDADDTLNSDFVNVFEKTIWADLVLCNFSITDPLQKKQKSETFFDRDCELPSCSILTYIKQYYKQPNKYSLFTTCWGKFYRTKALCCAGAILFNERLQLCEDTEFVFRFLSKQTGGVQFVNNSFYEHTVAIGESNRNKATFGFKVDLSKQLSFISAVKSSRAYMVKNNFDREELRLLILHCIGAYLIIYSVRSCVKIRSIKDFYYVANFWKKNCQRPIFKRAIKTYSSKVAQGNVIIPFLLRNNYYFLAIIVAYFAFRKRYFY